MFLIPLIQKNPKNANRLLIFNEGKLEDEIEFDDIRNPQTVISDRENNRIFLEQNITVQPEDSQGLNLKVIDTNSKEVIKELYLKGYIRDYYVGEKEIVLSLEGSKKLDFRCTGQKFICHKQKKLQKEE